MLITVLCLVSLPGILLLPETNNEALEDAYHQSRDETSCHETQDSKPCPDMNNIETDLNGAQTTAC